MQLVILWDHHELDGIDTPLYNYGVHKLEFNVKRKENFIKKFIAKLKKEVLSLVFEMNISDTKFNTLYSLFKFPNDYYSDFLVICSEENLHHHGYLSIDSNKQIIFYPTTKISKEEIESKYNLTI